MSTTTVQPSWRTEVFSLLVGRRAMLVAVGFLLAASPASAEEAPVPPQLPGWERFYTDGTEDSVAAGEFLLTELNCVSCHTPNGAANDVPEGTQASASEDAGVHARLAPKQAPILTEVSGRVRADYLRRFLKDPQAVKPGTTMPQLFHRVAPEQRERQVEALVHYLVSLGPGEPVQEFPILGSSAVGERLYHQVGCVACHGPRPTSDSDDAPASEAARTPVAHPQLTTTVPLGELLQKYTFPSLTDFLRDPLHIRPSGRMPNVNLTSGESRAVASFLLKGLPEVANIEYRYYEGNWDDVPDFTALEPKAQGGTSKMDVSLRQRDDQFGLRFDGFLRIDKEGEYTFHLGSDDGSRLWIDDEPVIVNGGVHPHTIKSQEVRLASGIHAIAVDYFEQGGEEQLTVEWEGPEIARQPLAAAMSAAKAAPEKETLAIQVNPQLAAEGRELFVSVGCANCHEVRENEQKVASELHSKRLSELTSSKGCLAEDSQRQVPHYNLSQTQHDALRSILAAQQNSAAGTNDRSLADVQQRTIHHTLVRFNCYACHERGKRGGVESQRNPWFETTTQEMGDEGRIPPLLDGIGAKLTRYWLEKLFAEGANDRPYMLTRMPKFGLENVGHLVPLLDEVDQVDPVPEVEFSESVEQVKDYGRQMVGSRGFSCIKCHTFGRFRATGIQSIDMKTMTRRLQRDWFVRYVKDPAQFRPGTRMPSAWPVEKSLLPILDADNQKQIAAVWLYLSEGPRAKIPEGLVMPSMELIPVDEAILYRNFIDGAGPRAIGVGNPEHIHYAYDAQQGRLALLWQGKYIDASRHWSGRGQGFEPPAGENVIRLAAGSEFAVLSDPAEFWPSPRDPNAPASEESGQDFEFQGYRLAEDQRPVFQYRIGPVKIEDFCDTRPASAGDGLLKRTFTLKTSTSQDALYLRVARANSIEAAGDHWYAIGDSWRVQVPGVKPLIRDAGGQQELLVPVSFHDGQAANRRAQFSILYRW